MADSPRIEDLRRRVDHDPASIAFAQLAEEYRRAGMYEDAVRVARVGLTHHPGYLSARVTLGRALVELGELDAAKIELDTVIRSAPENLAAIRALAEIHQRRGDIPEPPSAPEPPSPRLKALEPLRESPLPASEPILQAVPPDTHPPVLDVRSEPQETEPALDLDLHEFNRALETLDALTFALPGPESPGRAADEFDLAAFHVEEGDRTAEPEEDWNLAALDRPAEQTGESVPREAESEVTDVEQSFKPVNPALAELEEWLTALVSDRASRGRR